MEKEFLAVFEQALEKEIGSIQMSDQFREYDEWDSLALLSLGAELNERFDIVIPEKIFSELKTVEEVYHFVINHIQK